CKERNSKIQITVIGAVDHPLGNNIGSGWPKRRLGPPHSLGDISHSVGAIAQFRHGLHEMHFCFRQPINTNPEKTRIKQSQRLGIRLAYVINSDFWSFSIVPGRRPPLLKEEGVAMCTVNDDIECYRID